MTEEIDWNLIFNKPSTFEDSDAIHDNVAGEINAITEKAVPVSADLLVIEDSAASNAKKKVQVGNAVKGMSHTNIADKGTKTHAQIDSHVDATNNPHSTSDANLVTTDVTDNNVSITKHGFAPKAPNQAAKVLLGDATWNFLDHEDLLNIGIITHDNIDGHILSFDAHGFAESGWIYTSETWTYASADSPTFTFTITGDKTSKYSTGMRIQLTQTTIKYFIITKVEYSSPNTIITIYGGTDYTLANATITSPYYSTHKAPHGFPLDPAKWTVEVINNSDVYQNSPTAGVWYNLGSISITIPVGCWIIQDYAGGYTVIGTATGLSVYTTLSIANNTESDANFSTAFYVANATSVSSTLSKSKFLTLLAKTIYYLNVKTMTASTTKIQLSGSVIPTTIRAVCAYL